MQAGVSPQEQAYQQNGFEQGFEPGFEQGFEPGFGQQGFEPGFGQQGFAPPEYPQRGSQPGSYQPQGPQPPPPSPESRLPWPPPGGQLPLPPPPPAGLPAAYGAPVPPPPQTMSDTERMLRPQGLFQHRPFGAPGSFGPQGQFSPSAWPAPPVGMPAPPPGTDGPPLPGPRRRMVPAIIATALAIVVVVGLMAVLQSMRGGGSSGAPVAASSTPKPTTSASGQAQRAAAVRLTGLLSQSGNDRGAVIDAVVNVQQCGKTLAQDEQTFTKAAANRRNLLTRLNRLPGRSTLPAAMISALIGGWRASAQADSDLAKWTADEISQGCHKNKTANDPNLKASYGPDNQATLDKRAFTKLWNPIARRYGLKTYQWEQI